MEAKAPIVRKVYNVDEVAEILQTSSIKVRNLIKFGYLKAFRIGRVLVRDKDRDAFLETAVGLDFTAAGPVPLGEGGNVDC